MKINKIWQDLKFLKWYEWVFIGVIGSFLIAVGLYHFGTHQWSWQQDKIYKGIFMTLSGLVSFTGIMCVFLVGKGKISNYFWGAINTFIYGLYAFSVGYTGDALLNIVFFFPFQFIGLAMWKKHMTTAKDDVVIVNPLLKKDLIIYTIVTFGLFGLFWIVIPGVDVELHTKVLKDQGIGYDYVFRNNYLPRVFDTLTNTLSVIASIFMLKRFKQQWHLWILINIIQLTMYAGINGYTANIPMIIMWGAFTVNAIIALFRWNKRSLKTKQSSQKPPIV